jgi:hypothetical protein
MDVRTGIKVYSTFLAAGLAGPTMRLHAAIGGAKALEEAHFEADAAIALAAAMERIGVATRSSARGPRKRRSTPPARATLVNSRLPGQPDASASRPERTRRSRLAMGTGGGVRVSFSAAGH